MNAWWVLLIGLSLLWALPMYGVHQAQMPTLFFVAVTVFWAVLFVCTAPWQNT